MQKNFKLSFLVLLLSFFIACSNSVSKAGNDEDTGTSGQDEETILDEDMDSEITEDGDTLITDEENNNVCDLDVPETVCGNNLIENGEVCDGDTKPCTELGNYKDGIAVCKSDCSGYDTSKCVPNTEVNIYGHLQLSAKFDYLLDAAKMQDQQYMQQHIRDLIWGAIAQGTFTSQNRPIPTAGIQTISMGLHGQTDPNNPVTTVTAVQQGLIMNGQNPTPQGPGVIISFPGDNIKEDTYTIDVQGKNNVFLGVIETTDPQTEQTCLHALGIKGTLTVTKAEDTQKPEGGKLYFEGETDIFHPTETPYGDISQYMNTAICPKE